MIKKKVLRSFSILLLSIFCVRVPISVLARDNSVLTKDVEKKSTDGYEELESFVSLDGSTDISYKGLNFTINSEVQIEANKYYPSSKDHTYPYLTFSVIESEKDFSNIQESELKDIIKTQAESEISTIGNTRKYNIKKKKLDSSDCYYVTYKYNFDEDSAEQLLSDKLKVESLYIPTSFGLYEASFIKYENDDNSYKFNSFYKSFKVTELEQFCKSLNEQKTDIDAIALNGNASDQERQIFDIRKQEALNLIANHASLEEINNAKDSINQTNTDIQARVDQEAAHRAEQQASIRAQQEQTSSSGQGYYCMDGTYVGNADPHARGRANACYGHGGFAVNH